MALEKVRVQNKLIDMGLAGPYYAITYNTSQKAVRGAVVQPAEVLANEVSANFGLPERNRRSYRDDRLEWLWELRLSFNQEVTLEEFEQTIMAAPILLPADKNAGNRQVSLHFRSVSYIHPPTQSPRTGTKVTYLMNARLWPA